MASGKRVIMAGAFPPPTHGMAAVNAAVRDRLLGAGSDVQVIDVAAPSLDRGTLKRLGRVPRVLRGWLRLAMLPGLRDTTFYMSVSGGFGQVYELGFLALARVRRMRLVLHHHSFAYVDRPNRLTSLLMRLGGRDSVHVVLSRGMGDRLAACYPAHGEIMAMSNAALLLEENEPECSAVCTDAVRVLGFLSNLSAEKGVFDFLDVVERALAGGLEIAARLAGPFQDEETEQQVRKRLQSLPQVDYLGPVYGKEKDAFYRGIDVLLFATRYRNEAEPLVVLEALKLRVPVIAFGRGAIPEYIDESCGYVVNTDEDFVQAALPVLSRWIANSGIYQELSENAHRRFVERRSVANVAWQKLERLLLAEE